MFGNSEAIWGECDKKHGSCTLSSEFQCSSFASEGPAAARWEIKLTNLPASTDDAPVHFQWWAGRAADPSFDILASHSTSECPTMTSTYPKYSDADFNGGNVLVGEDGTAILKVDSPLSYSVSHHCGSNSHHDRNHHIHFRFCTGERTLEKSGKIDFSSHGVFMKGRGCSRHGSSSETDYGIAYIKDLTTGDVRVPTSTNSYHNLYSDWVSQSDTPATAAPSTPAPTTTTEEAAANNEVQPAPADEPETAQEDPSSETVASASSEPEQDAEDAGEVASAEQEVDEESETLTVLAREGFNTEVPDMDALEFSAIYNCMDQGKLFSQFTNDCTDACAEGQAVKHGQCVREPVLDAPVKIDAQWQLTLDCDERCWAERSDETLHNVRLAVGDLLDVPFQEAKKVRMRFDTERRLQAVAPQRQATLSVEVVTRRMQQAEGHEMLSAFLSSSGEAQAVLGMTVFAISTEHDLATATLAQDLAPAEAQDQYLDDYAALEVRLEGGLQDDEDTGLPVALLVGIGAVVVAAAAFVSALVCYRRRQVMVKMAEEEAAEIEADKLGKVDDPNPSAAQVVGVDVPELAAGTSQTPNPAFSTTV